MKKKILLGVGMAVPLAASAANAMSGACTALQSSVTGTFGQAWNYAQCIGDSISAAWDLFYNFF